MIDAFRIFDPHGMGVASVSDFRDGLNELGL